MHCGSGRMHPVEAHPPSKQAVALDGEHVLWVVVPTKALSESWATAAPRVSSAIIVLRGS